MVEATAGGGGRRKYGDKLENGDRDGPGDCMLAGTLAGVCM